MSSPTRVGILGLGTVGTGVVSLLAGNPQFEIRKIAVRNRNKARDVNLSGISLTEDPLEIVNDPDIDVVVEVAGGINPVYDLIKRAVSNGKHVVTANKELIARHGAEIFDLAHRRNVTIFFEAAVGGGIPLISTLQRGLQANRIERVAGILNGTTNYILTKMEFEKRSFESALAEAQASGFAEADPTDDIEGRDVVYKIAILSSLAFALPVEVEKIYRQGISSVTDLDIKLAGEFGYRVKMIGLARRAQGKRLDVRAHPMLVPFHHPLAGVEGVNNAIFISGDAVGEIMLQGPGAGRLPTASAVVGDLISLASTLNMPEFARYFKPQIGPEVSDIVPIEETSSAYYLRLETTDTPGVIGSLGHAFGAHDVSLHSVSQRGVDDSDAATIILLTHRVAEQKLLDALSEIVAQRTTRKVGIVLRVLD